MAHREGTHSLRTAPKRNHRAENMTETVAVIVPTYNRAHLVGQTIESILQQTRLPDEILVVDDGSTDETADVVAAFGHQIRYIKKENAGKAAALNRAMKEIGADYVWTIDDDDIALPNALQMHLEALANRADADFSYSAHYEFTGDRPPDLKSLSSQAPMAIASTSPDNLFVRAMLWFPFYLQGMLVPRRCYEHVGPFDESLTFTEDYDMILRLTRHFRGKDVGAPTFCLRVHPGVRGPAHEQRSARDRHRTFRGYDSGTFERLRADLPLADYLPRGSVSGGLSGSEERRARLQRACIMSRHGLFAMAFEDLNAVFGSRGDSALGEGERRILVQMLNVEPWWLRVYPDYAALVGRLLRRHRAEDALRACATGLSWQLENCVRHGRYREALHIAVQLHQLIGTARVPAFFARALVRYFRGRGA